MSEKRHDERQGERRSGAEAGDGLTLEARLERLERILASLESEELELDAALALFEEGVTHIREAERVLAEASLRVEEVLADGGVRPLDVSAEGEA
ncbi:MAG: exodeoxyribonuclease VII small subunit [Longimicrobiales bacterium]|nr:exodeoxyribonuclease VII small subunit [Longimicrobiales bacterium]